MLQTDEIVRLGQIELHFRVDPAANAESMTAFDLHLPPAARVPAAHYHRSVDELFLVQRGTIRYTIDGVVSDLAAGEHRFVPRGAVHHFINVGTEPAQALVVLTPGTIGPAFFREVAAAAAGGPPDPNVIAAIMDRHGLVPA